MATESTEPSEDLQIMSVFSVDSVAISHDFVLTKCHSPIPIIYQE